MRTTRRSGCAFGVALALACTIAGANIAAAQTCERAEFEAVVDGAAETLRTLTQKFSPAFQAKLRQLREKRGWSQEQFLAEGARFVRDEKTTEFDEKSEQLLAEINSTGNTGSAKPDCTLLVKLKGAMQSLVETQNAKWAYMFGKIDSELGKP